MERTDMVIYKGIPITGTMDSIYCDKCGSFKIRKRLTLRTFIWAIIAAIIATAFWKIAQNDAIFGGIMCFTLQLLAMSALQIFTVGYKCRKCGNKHITLGNTLNYPEFYRGVLDIPYEKTITIYTDTVEGY